MFNPIIKLYIDYGNLASGVATNTNLLKRQQALKKAVRIIAF